jgi:hypothetical protein
MKKRQFKTLSTVERGPANEGSDPEASATAFPALAVGLLALAALLVFLPAFVNDFGIHNDYMMGYPRHWTWETRNLKLVGRPLGALLIDIQSQLYTTVAGLRVQRFVSFLLSIAAGALVFRHFWKRIPLPPLWAAGATFCILLLPTVQVQVLWATNLPPGSIAMLLTVTTYYVLGQAFLDRDWTAGALGRVAAAMAVFVATALIYPPTALFLLAFPFAHLAFMPLEEWPKVRRRIFRDLLFVVVGLLIYFLIAKVYVAAEATATPENRRHMEWILKESPYRLAVAIDVWSKIPLLYHMLVLGLSGIWHLAFDTWAALAVVAVLAAGWGYLACQAIGRGQEVSDMSNGDRTPSLAQFALMLLCGAAMLLLSMSPQLAAANCGADRALPEQVHGIIGYRTMYAPTTLLTLLGFAMLWRLASAWRDGVKAWLVRGAVGALVVGSCLVTARNVVLVTKNFGMELDYVRHRLFQVDTAWTRSIFLLHVPRGGQLIEVPLHYEFTLMTTCEAHIHSVVLETLYGRKCQIQRLLITGPLSAWAGPALALDNRAVVIDIAEARGVAAPAIQETRSLSRVHFSSPSGESTGVMAMDGDSSTAWETDGFPQSIIVTPPAPITRFLYRLSPATGGARHMPTAWHVDASYDGAHWQTVGKQEASDWEESQPREFAALADKPAVSFRLVFDSGGELQMRIGEFLFAIAEQRASPAAAQKTSTATPQHGRP